MRPPHECGGKPRIAFTPKDAAKCFNEAPARMRGKMGLLCGGCRTDSGFNEAPARMRGKTHMLTMCVNLTYSLQ